MAERLDNEAWTGEDLLERLIGWGEHFATRIVVESPDLAIYQVSRPARGCLGYVVASEGKAIVIDPLRHLHPYLDLARNAGLTRDLMGIAESELIDGLEFAGVGSFLGDSLNSRTSMFI
jgi:DsrE/DsrF/DrsH-like family